MLTKLTLCKCIDLSGIADEKPLVQSGRINVLPGKERAAEMSAVPPTRVSVVKIGRRARREIFLIEEEICYG